jgi:hypothetical protein
MGWLWHHPVIPKCSLDDDSCPEAVVRVTTLEQAARRIESDAEAVPRLGRRKLCAA